MSYQTPMESAFNETVMRSKKLSPSGMCSFCCEDCVGTCSWRTIHPVCRTLSFINGGSAVDEFSTGAIGVYSYLKRIAFGLQHFAALNRKFDINLADQSDLIPLTLPAKEIAKGEWFK